MSDGTVHRDDDAFFPICQRLLDGLLIDFGDRGFETLRGFVRDARRSSVRVSNHQHQDVRVDTRQHDKWHLATADNAGRHNKQAHCKRDHNRRMSQRPTEAWHVGPVDEAVEKATDTPIHPCKTTRGKSDWRKKP